MFFPAVGKALRCPPRVGRPVERCGGDRNAPFRARPRTTVFDRERPFSHVCAVLRPFTRVADAKSARTIKTTEMRLPI
eukprot:804706-Lingulodinium_polyedra.AAC.1